MKLYNLCLVLPKGETMKNSNNKILDAWIKVEQLSEGSIDRKKLKYKIFQENDYQKVLRNFLNQQKLESNSGIAIYCGIFPFKKLLKD